MEGLSMAKNIVFCADGTWNGPGGDANDTSPPSNVWKLFLALAGELDPGTLPLAHEQEKVLTGPNPQVAKYLHGVGDSSLIIDRLFGGVFGSGTIERIVRGYTFVSRNYEDGDRIYLVGFSRGAYTARALGGLIGDMGLLNNDGNRLDDKALAYRLGAMTWRAHREKRIAARSGTAVNAGLMSVFQNVLDGLPHFVSKDLAAGDLVPSRNRIRAIGVWDTVGALGIPLYLDTDERVDVFRFADTNLNANVENGLHAISLDEQRDDFEPTLWQNRDNVTQVLFPGAHSDVGGGYPANQTGLSDGALTWMIARLAALGLHFNNALGLAPADPLAVAHRPWAKGIFASLRHSPRQILQDEQVTAELRFHVSLKQRLSGQQTLWDPDDGSITYIPTVLAQRLSENDAWESP
jgi:uncharacterized protein (DUF2235 family)